jgi:signal transduction histidine kinase
MKNNILPIPLNEMDRLLALAALDLDYSNLEEHFRDLTLLAAKVAGTEISLINLIDSFTQWTISNHGLPLNQMPREESACQYTIMTPGHFEVPDLAADERFKLKFYVDGPLGLRYYLGLPLKSAEGVNIGALCVLDTQVKQMSPEKIELLEIIGETVVKRLHSLQAIDLLRQRLKEANDSKNKAAHDIRGPLAGIIGLSNIITDQGSACALQEMMEYVGLINKSSRTILELADEILSGNKLKPLEENEFNLALFKDKLEKLYAPQARYKDISLKVNVNPQSENRPFSKNKLLQIAGNLISNAIKFTPTSGIITVDLDLIVNEEKSILKISVTDTGIGMEQSVIDNLLKGNSSTTPGTAGEKGFGFGLSLVSHLVESLNGSFNITAIPGQGSRFEVALPQSQY